MTYVHTHNEVLGSKQLPASGVVQKIIKPLKNSTNNNVTNKFCISSGILQSYFLEHPVACSLTPAAGMRAKKYLRQRKGKRRKRRRKNGHAAVSPPFSRFYICADPCFAIFFPAFVPPLNPPFWTPTKKGKRRGKKTLKEGIS